MADLSHKKRHFTSFQIIILGFASVILAGALLLMLPLSSKSGIAPSFNEALFTSTSSVCVTGLVVQDTATYWSIFGQSIILILIQIGGLGVITVAVAFALLSGKKITLMQRSTMQEAIADSRRSLGLGLALCRPIINAHGGEITLKDNKPHGCIFTFTIPSKEVNIDE